MGEPCDRYKQPRNGQQHGGKDRKEGWRERRAKPRRCTEEWRGTRIWVCDDGSKPGLACLLGLIPGVAGSSLPSSLPPTRILQI